MFYAPAILPLGWCLYAFDFTKKKITVLDPLIGTTGFSNESIRLHEYATGKILMGCSCVRGTSTPTGPTKQKDGPETSP